MNKTLQILSGNPGVGKTQQFIETIKTDKRYVYAAPTRVLALEVMDRLDEVGKPYLPIFTGQTKEGQVGRVIQRANQALTDKTTPILIITHKCLASVKPGLVAGWELVIDEAPKVEEIENVSVIASEWETVFAPFIGDCDENGYIILNDARAEDAWEIYAQGLEDARNQRRRRNSTLLMVLEGMFSATKHVTATSSKDNKGKAVVRVSMEGFTDFTRTFDYANSVTLMGANVERSLLVS